MKKEKLVSILLIVIASISVIVAFLSPPISQDVNYHNFSDKRTIFEIPNFWNVITNLPFFFVGFLGLSRLKNRKKIVIAQENKNAYWLFYLGILFVSFGSGFYHLNPQNDTLVWDRLPMTMAFMSLFSILVTEFISIQKGKIFLIPLFVLGILSVLYWNYTESIGSGNLNYYILVQFYPIVAIPIILLSYSSLFTKGKSYWILLLAYIIAKVCEHFDSEIHNVLGFISGHSIKHVIAALGLYIVLYTFEKREK